LEDGAQAVLGALELIKNRIATALGKEVPFNEVLSAAYMEKQKMAVSDVISKPHQNTPYGTNANVCSSIVTVSGVWAQLLPRFP
jgi:hypothetical protein